VPVGSGEQGKVLDAGNQNEMLSRQYETPSPPPVSLFHFFKRNFILLADVLVPGELKLQGVTLDGNSFLLFPQREGTKVMEQK
jgi:hypothetical protein